MRTHEISNRRPEKFISCRVGLELLNYQEELAGVLAANNINDKANFIVTPIAPPRSIYYDCNRSDMESNQHNELHLIPDLVLPTEVWEKQVAISLGQLPFYSDDHSQAITVFRKLLKHALYLSSPVVVIECPETKTVQRAVASVINQSLRDKPNEKLIIIRITLGYRPKQSSPSKSSQSTSSQSGSCTFSQDIPRGDGQKLQDTASNMDIADESTGDSGLCFSSNSSVHNETTNASQLFMQEDWTIWNSFKSFLEPDHRLGICLAIQDNFECQCEEMERWTGEPIRMVSLSVDRFNYFSSTLRMAGNIREFMRTIALSNSLKTSFVVQAKAGVNIQDHLQCLSGFCDMLDQEHSDPLRGWNDTLLLPLQPLSNDLDSSTYRVFEVDSAKYCKYHEAMVEALNVLMTREASIGRSSFVIMVLGAGRGPLVDAMLKAIRGLNLLHVHFLIYALDKNYSSIRSLKYKKVREWDNYLPNIRVDVVEADMRTWTPAEKADIIATELLGSFSDNELSPECIDGTWRFATEQTLSIPQSYSSYLAPIQSFRMHQELHKSRFYTNEVDVYDQLHVVRLSNYYHISEPKELFRFTHYDLSKEPVEKANERQVTLRFHAKVDTVCNGFAGYFTANLFGSVEISTVPSYKTPTMESWFSAFIPIKSPVQVPANTCLEVKFYRKDSKDKVWYEWIVTEPELSKIHSKDGQGTSMYKSI